MNKSVFKDVCLVVNTTTGCSDLWNMFQDTINSYGDIFERKYIFVDRTDYKFDNTFTIINYDSQKAYSEQFYDCIQQVNEDYCIYIAEDYLLYDYLNYELILEQLHVLNNEDELSFIKMVRGPEDCIPFKNYKKLFQLSNSDSNFYTNQATLWKTRHLEKIYEISPPMHIADKRGMLQFESHAHHLCRKLNMGGCFYYDGEPKRGVYHYDSKLFPYINTALIKGKWNLSEYSQELLPLLKKYNILIDDRGVY